MVAKKIKNIPYNIKNGLKRYALIALAPLMLNTACEKEEPIVQHDTTYVLKTPGYDGMHQELEANIAASADSVEVRNIYLTPEGNWSKFSSNYWHNVIPTFEKKAAISPKVKCRGNFVIGPRFEDEYGFYGEILPADSLKLVKLGFTVNQQNQK